MCCAGPQAAASARSWWPPIDETIAAAVEKAGGRAVMTRADHPSGFRPHLRGAWQAVDPEGHAKIIVNVQGDLPTLEPGRARRRRSSRSPIPRSISRPWRPRSSSRRSATIPTWSRWSAPRSRHAGCARSISPAPRRRPATGRSTITSASTPIAAPRWQRFVALPPSPLEQRETARAVARAGSRHADRRDDRRHGAARRRHAGGLWNGPRDAARRPLTRIPSTGRNETAWRPSKESRSRASPGPIRTWRSTKPIPTAKRCRARPSRMRSPPSAPATCDLGMIPIENSLAGRVADIHHLMPQSDLHIIGEHFMPVRHQLLGHQGRDARRHQDRARATSTRSASAARSSASSASEPMVAADTAGSAREIAELGDKIARRHRAAARRRNLRPRHPRRGHRGRGAQHHALHHPVAREEMGAARRRQGRHHLRVPGHATCRPRSTRRSAASPPTAST